MMNGDHDPYDGFGAIGWLVGALCFFVVILLILVLAFSDSRPAELMLWVTLPTKDADSVECETYIDSAGVLRRDRNAPGSPLSDLRWTRWYARSFNDSTVLTAQDDIGSASPGDSVGALFDFAGGTMGMVWVTAVDDDGTESCVGPSYVFAVPIDTAGAPSGPSGPGLIGRYYRGIDLGWFLAERMDSQVNFTWPGSPIPGAPADSFSARWSGLVKVPRAGHVTYYLNMNNAGRLWAGDSLKIDSWVPGTARELYGIAYYPAPGTYPIRVEMYELTAEAKCVLSWKVPSYTGTKGVIPASALEH